MMVLRLTILMMILGLVGLAAPCVGVWAEEDGGEDGARVQMGARSGNLPPTIEIVEPDGVSDAGDEGFTIEWVDDDPDDNATISLYYVAVNGGGDVGLIAEFIEEDDGADQFTWETAALPEGDYHVYAMIDDGVNTAVVRYGGGAVSVAHVVDPDARALTISGAPGGAVSAPGEGSFLFGNGETVQLVALPDPGWRFIAWTGDVNAAAGVDAAITTITMNGNFAIRPVFSQETPWPPVNDLSDASVSFTGAAADGWAGASAAAAGDVNGDGYDDFLIGAYMEDVDGKEAAGRVHLVLGKGSGWSGVVDLAAVDASFTGEAAFDHAGISAGGAGDVNGDGYDDILISACGARAGGTGVGLAYVVFGKTSGWAGNTSLSTADASFVGQDAGAACNGALDARDERGWSVNAAGDVNGDGFDDILIGDARDDAGGVDAGQAWLILGKATGWTAGASLSLADASFVGEEAGNGAGGAAVSAGDVNGDGLDDILVGASGSDRAPETAQAPPGARAATDEVGDNGRDGAPAGVGDGAVDAGRTHLIFGKTSGWVMGAALSEAADASFVGAGEGNRSGARVASAGDVNGDGFGDFLIGDYQNDTGREPAALAWLIPGGAGGWTMDMDLSAAAAASFLGRGIGGQALFSAGSAGDFDNDGYGDLLLGDYTNGEGGALAGKTGLVRGKASGWKMNEDLSEAAVVFMGEAADDLSGYAASPAGDVNGDGFGDILVGAPGAGGAMAGRAYLVLGGYASSTRLLTVAAGEGGAATGPGAGVFEYEAGAAIPLAAAPDPGYRFNRWTGEVGAVVDVDAATTTIHMDVDYSVTAEFIPENAPSIRIVEPDGVGDAADEASAYTFTIAWTDDDPDDDAEISFYHCQDLTGEGGELIATGIREDDETDGFTWDASDLLAGEYYVYAVIDDGVHARMVDVGHGPVSVRRNAPPSIRVMEPNGDDACDGRFTITWTDEDPDDNARISLYYDTDDAGEDGVLIVSDIAEDDVFSAMDVVEGYEWVVTALPEGAYYIYAVIDDGTNPPAVDYSDGPVTIVDVIRYPVIWSGNPYSRMNLWTLSATIDGVGLARGDQIGVYDGEKCVGSSVVDGPISTLNPLIVTASMDDGDDNGFTPGGFISIKIWDASARREFTAITADYLELATGDPITPPVFEADGDYGLELSVNGSESHAISLAAGWNLFSSRLTPDDPDLLSVLQPLIAADLLSKVSDGDGAMIVEVNGEWVNGIGALDPLAGYEIMVKQACSLVIPGDPAPLPAVVSLDAGWNLIGYPSAAARDALDVLQPLIDSGALVQVIDDNGNGVLEVDGIWINQIGNFKKGEGYLVEVMVDAYLTIE